MCKIRIKLIYISNRLKYFIGHMFFVRKFSKCKLYSHICNTDEPIRMNVITKRTILYYIDQYPSAKTALLSWLKEFGSTNFNNFNELKQVYGNSSLLAGHRVIFNIKGNDFRLIASVNFNARAAYVIWFGSHQEYDQINASEIKHIEI